MLTERKRSFAPVVNQDVRVLILGSLPGDVSLLHEQYYAHPQNKFWELTGAVIDVDLRALDYQRRLQVLLAHGIGLWDVIATAERVGSLDAAIRNAAHNPLAALITTLPVLKVVAFNGGTAARSGRRQLRNCIPHLTLSDLPSSSPAYTTAYEHKLQMWLHLRAFVA